MNFYYGKSEEFAVRLNKTDYLYYVYKNITDIAGLILWLNNSNVPTGIDQLYANLYSIDNLKIIPMVIKNFAIFSNAYLQIRLSGSLKKVIIPYKLDTFPATSFLYQKISTVNFLYDTDKLEKFFGSFNVLHSLYTKNINNLIEELDPIEESIRYQNIKSLIDNLDNSQQKSEVLTKNLLDSLILSSGFDNSDNLKADISKLVYKQSSFIQNQNRRQNTTIMIPDENPTDVHSNLPMVLRSTVKPHLTILLAIFNLFETALKPVFVNVADEINEFNELMQLQAKFKLSKNQKIESFANSFTIKYEKKTEKTGTW